MSVASALELCVCLKPIPDPQGALDPAPDGRWIAAESTPVLSEGDESALEVGLRSKERFGGRLTAVTVADERGEAVLRRALSLGVDRAVHVVTDTGILDPHAVAEILRRALERFGPFDLALTGAQSQALGSAITGTLLAARLGWSHSWLGLEIRELDESGLVARRELEGGAASVERLTRPAVVQLQAGIHPLRMAKIRDVIAAKKRSIERIALAELGERPQERLRIVRLEQPAAGSCVRLGGSVEEAAAELIETLRQEGLLGRDGGTP